MIRIDWKYSEMKFQCCSVCLFYFVLFSSLRFSLYFQALLEVLQQDQPELTEAAATMTQQQRDNWLQHISDKISSLDPGIVRFTVWSLCLSCSCYEPFTL